MGTHVRVQVQVAWRTTHDAAIRDSVFHSNAFESAVAIGFTRNAVIEVSQAISDRKPLDATALHP